MILEFVEKGIFMKIEDIQIYRSARYNEMALSFSWLEDIDKQTLDGDFYLVSQDGKKYFLPKLERNANSLVFSFSKIPEFGRFGLEIFKTNKSIEKVVVRKKVADESLLDRSEEEFNDELSTFLENDWGIEAGELVNTLVNNEKKLFKDKWKLNVNSDYFIESLQKVIDDIEDYIVIFEPQVLSATGIAFNVDPSIMDYPDKIGIFARHTKNNEKNNLFFRIEKNRINIDISNLDFLDIGEWKLFMSYNGRDYRLYYPENQAACNATESTMQMGQISEGVNYLSFDKSNRIIIERLNVEDSKKREKKRLVFDDSQQLNRVTENAISKFSRLKKVPYQALKIGAIKSENGLLSFSIKNNIRIDEMFLINNKTDTVLKVDFKNDEDVYNIDVHNILLLFNDEVARFTLYASYVNNEGRYGFSRLLYDGYSEMKDFERFFDSIPFHNSNLSLSSRFYLSKSGYLTLVNRDSLVVDKDERKAPVKVAVNSLKVKNGVLYFSLDFDIISKAFNNNWNLIVKNAFLYKTIFHSEKINLTIDEVNTAKNQVRLSQNLATLLDKSIFGNYRLAIQLEINNKDVNVICDIASKGLTKKLYSGRMNFTKKERIFFPKIGLKKDLSFFIDDVQKIDHPFNNFLENITAKLFENNMVKEKKGKYLLFEKETNYAQDNSFALFEWIQNNVKDNRSYYVIKKESMALSKLKKYKKRVIYTGSLKYYWHILTCDMLVSADNPIQLYDGQRASASPLVKKVIYKKLDVMLQHGVTAFKNIGKSHNWRAEPRILDYFVVTSPFERKIVHDNLGYSYKQLPILGFTRWDRLDINNIQENVENNEILFCPTWRKWLSTATDAELVESDYYKKIESLLTNKYLLDNLEKENKNLIVYLHPIMQKFTKNFESNNRHIKIMSNDEVDLSVLIKRCACIVTDYSSVSWDFAVQRKPVIFYQFDRERYEKVFGSFVDLKEIPIGPSYENEEETVESIVQLMQNGFKNNDYIIENINKLFGEEKKNYSEQTYNFVNTLSNRKKNTFWNKKIGRITANKI